jgi:uncharacterized protein (TIGR02594 family)
MKPNYIVIAEKEMGVKEVPGKGSNPRILEYHKATKLGATDDAIAWCSSFVNWVLMKAGYQRTYSAAARSWLGAGEVLKKFEPNCIVVLKRGKSAWQGHVGFGIEQKGGYVTLLGGNQGDKVSLAKFPVEAVLGYRRPLPNKA